MRTSIVFPNPNPVAASRYNADKCAFAVRTEAIILVSSFSAPVEDQPQDGQQTQSSETPDTQNAQDK
jgi:hypothetical protein